MTPVRWLLAAAAELPAELPAEDQDGWLDADARERLARMPVPQRRADFRLGRWTAKRAVATWLGLDARALARIAILAAEDGAPEAFLDGAPAPLVLSLTHRAGLAVCAVAPAGTALGCDLETIEPRSPAFVADYLTLAERALIEAAPEADRPLLVNLIWSAKESALKALRTGLRLDTREVEVELPEEGEAAGWSPLTVHRRETGELFQGWWRRQGEHVLTLAARPAPAVPVRIWSSNL